jgi:hypothetical protein
MWKSSWQNISGMNAKDLLPGHELVEEGLRDLAANRVTDCSLLLQIAAPKLAGLGVPIQVLQPATPYEHQLYERLEERLGSGAHSYYNSLIRRIVSYAHALERQTAIEP